MDQWCVIQSEAMVVFEKSFVLRNHSVVVTKRPTEQGTNGRDAKYNESHTGIRSSQQTFRCDGLTQADLIDTEDRSRQSKQELGHTQKKESEAVA